MKLHLAIISSTVYGLIIRLAFEFFGAGWEIMSLSFLVLTPAIIGFLTVFLLPATKVTNVRSAFFIPWLTSLAILVITVVFAVEGTICWLMIYPFFASLTGVGGIMALYVKQSRGEKKDQQNGLSISLLILLPLVAGYIEHDRLAANEIQSTSSEILINAPTAQVWQTLTKAGSIPAQQHQSGLTTAIGFPRYVKTVQEPLAVGAHRVAYYEKGLFFNETIKQYEPNELLVLSVKTDPTKISPKVMDEHIIIGGKHFNLLEDRYQLQTIGKNQCKLILSSSFTICTPINWYSGIWAKFLMNDILKAQLQLVKSRAQAPNSN